MKKLKPLSFIPAILILTLIFSFSSQSGEDSGKLSYKISYKIVEIKNDLLNENKTESEIAATATRIHIYVRKAAHMTEYFILALAVAFPLYVYRIRGLLLFFTAGFLCVASAAFDEYHQSFVAGRGPSIRDVGIDSVGAFFGILTIQLFCWLILHLTRKKH